MMAAITYIVVCFLMIYVESNAVEMEIEEGIDVEQYAPYQWHSFNSGKFLWSLCNKTAVPVVVTALSIEPDPIQFDQDISFSGAIDVNENVGTTTTLESHLKVMMKQGSKYFDVCVYKPEYCQFSNVCDKLKKYVSELCPEMYQSFCQCPFRKGSYPIPKITKKLPNPPITVSGEFDITMTLKESQKEIACLNVQLCLGQC